MSGKQAIKRELLTKITKVKENLTIIVGQLQELKVIEGKLDPFACWWWCRPDTTDHVTAARKATKAWEKALKEELT